MNNILISIILPVYNVEKYIKKCLDSILNQLNSNVELIIVDDCTCDNSIRICEDITQSIENVKILRRKENGGLSAARNSGLEIARGKYCWFIDSDDYIAPYAVEHILNSIETYTPDLLMFNHERVTEEGIITKQSKIEDLNINSINDNHKFRICANYIANKYEFEVWSKIYSMDIINKYNLRFEPNKEIFAEDICFNLYYLFHCNVIHTINESLYYYLLRNNSIMGSKKINKLKEMQNLSNKVYEHIYYTDASSLMVKDFYIIYAGIMNIEYRANSFDVIDRFICSNEYSDFSENMILYKMSIKKQIKLYKIYSKKIATLYIAYAKYINSSKKNHRLTKKVWKTIICMINKHRGKFLKN